MKLLSREDTNAIKGVAILCVILSHLRLLHRGGFSVSLFLFLSGYGICYSVMKNGKSDYWMKRLSGVYLPYLIFTLFHIMLMLLSNSESLNASSVLISLLGLDFGQNIDNTMWYISFQFLFYFAFYFAVHVDKKAVRLLIMAAAMLFALWGGHSTLIWHDGTMAWAYSFDFPLGVLAAKLEQGMSEKIRFPRLTWRLLACALSFYIVMTYGKEENAIRAITYSTSCAYLVIFIIKLVRCRLKLKILSFIGRYSFGMYLNEMVIISFLEFHISSKVLLLILSIVLCVVVSMAFTKLVDSMKNTIFVRGKA